MVDDVSRTIATFAGVENANGVLTAERSSDQVIAIASVAFDDALRAPEIQALIDEIEIAVVGRYTEIGRLFVRPQTPEGFAKARRQRFEEGYWPLSDRRG